ncbi:MAG: ATP-binding cassette domain-containing protein, partial [Planctomycetes bacterium]|nr:ATP-binding cassette domain-containing protein [Planctomycetota bacterium]
MIKSKGIRISHLKQEVPTNLKGRVLDLLKTSSLATAKGDGSWGDEHHALALTTRMELDPESEAGDLSAGLKRRVLLAQALMQKPDLLLLDEPTNHLDISSIEWLEAFLLRQDLPLIFVTHDRMFLRKLATRIVELDRGRIFSYDCNFEEYLVRRESMLESERQQRALFDKVLAQEEVWIRQGIKARRTRNEGRVRQLENLRLMRMERRDEPKQVRLTMQEAARSGQKVFDLKKVSFAYSDTPLFSDFTTTITKGDRVGVLGPNGCGKTTLVKILLGEIKPQTGIVEIGTNLQVAYFDQLHLQLDEKKSLMANIVDSEHVVINGVRKHILGYLQDFLFSAEKARGSIRNLSGGERNRLLLAKLFSKPSNVLVLDEPTNDLDSDTLDLLTEQLMEYSGTVINVSHDRDFLNSISTGIFSFDEPGVLREYVGGYDDWLRQRPAAHIFKNPEKSPPLQERRIVQKDLQKTLKTIEKLEASQTRIHAIMSAEAYYEKPPQEIATHGAELKKIEEELQSL